MDAISSAESQAKILAQKKRELEDEKNSLEVEKARMERARAKELAKAKDRTDKELVEISKAGEQQVDLVKKLNSERVRSVNDNTQKNFLDLSARTADQIKNLEQDALKTIEDRRLSTMERVKFVTDQSEDPFYRIKSLNPSLSEGDNAFTIKLALPEHEAENLFVSGDGKTVKLSLARRFQEQVKDGERAMSTKTSSFQTVVETLALPEATDSKTIRRDYADGVVTITVPKIATVPDPFVT